MLSLDTLIFMVAVLGTMSAIIHIRTHVQSGKVLSITITTTPFIFTLFISSIVIINASALHLIWMFPISLVIGSLLLFFPCGIRLAAGIVTVLAKY